ncbi:MAG: serine protease, partial [Bacteroidota bacterium]
MRQTFFLLGIFFLSLVSNAQIGPYKYFVAFTDKNGTPYNIYNPQAFLTQRAIQRRVNQSIEVTEQDLPVNPSYVSQVANIGV